MKGKLYGNDDKIKLKIYQKGSDKPLIDYDGPVNGLEKVVHEIKKLK
jgi:hypothetical protein